MSRDPRYDILFEPLAIGPHTARNRFFQVPHCNGMGCTFPNAMIAMREMKAKGGWAVVCTEETDFHPSNDFLPLAEGRLWDDSDVKLFAAMTDAIHKHGSLAGIELSHTGHRDANLYSREVPLSVSDWPVSDHYPVQAREMTRRDIREFRRWHREALLRAKRAGFDIIYIYLRPGASMPGHFLSPELNRRSDEYGGSFENRTRLFAEMLEDAKDTVGDTCAIAVRLTVDDPQTEARLVLERFAEVPDLWDVNVREWRRDSMPSRFGGEGSQESLIAFVKAVTTKPVVGVGRFTSPDTMASQIRRGIVDFIGAARPSIADPFLPNKIETGRIEDIRECIGCNICVSSDFTQVPLRCTQNPTMGEEWRKGWHPEIIAPKSTDERFLVVGGGPAGLECARALGARGYDVTLAEAREQLGGRVSVESAMPGFQEWARVRDYRRYQLDQMANVSVYLQSHLTSEDVLAFEADRVVIATGARWRRDGLGRHHRAPIPGWQSPHVTNPDDLSQIDGPVVVFDDDHYYIGAAVAEHLSVAGHEVCLVTPASDVGAWSANTLEQQFVEERLHACGVKILEKQALVAVRADCVEIAHIVSGGSRLLAARSVVMVTMRDPIRALYDELVAGTSQPVDLIGDCLSPSTIAAAVYSGHRYAREFDLDTRSDIPFKREKEGTSFV